VNGVITMTNTNNAKKTIGVLTGGGDAPGLNAVIRGVTIAAISSNYEVLGIRNGWAGLLGKGVTQTLTANDVEEILEKGGTILGTSRTNPYKHENGLKELKKNLKKYRIDHIIAIGGEDTLGVAKNLSSDGLDVVGVPKTIDNDVNGTDYTVGFDTAQKIAAEIITNLHTTAMSHSRTIVVEVMGRHAGWLTLYAGVAGGAHIILIPEQPFDFDKICEIIERREAQGLSHTIIACSEGATPKNGELVLQSSKVDEFNHVKLGGIAEQIAVQIEKKTKIECKSVVLGYLQRSGPPSANDKVLGTRFGLNAVKAVKNGEFGKMVALKGTEIVTVSLKEALANLKTVPQVLIDEANQSTNLV
jgi:ATP-dependent phosphofructokinase / diphosphate-dependent phosphofructokinase